MTERGRGGVRLSLQWLARDSLCDARSGESDRCIRLRDRYVRERAQAREHSAGCGLTEYGDVRDAGIGKESPGEH
jgi:hypothetical protein